MNRVNRWSAALLLGLSVTLALFWLMRTMIMTAPVRFRATDAPHWIEFIRLKREPPAPEEPPKPLKTPPPPEPRPETPQPTRAAAQAPAARQPALAMPSLDIPLAAATFADSVSADLSVAPESGTATPGAGIGAGSLSTDLIPLVRIPPRYPMRAAEHHIEGQVTVEFTITKTGRVVDARVVDAHPATIFNRAALSALRRWKFKPKVIDGHAVEQRARQILQFKLTR